MRGYDIKRTVYQPYVEGDTDRIGKISRKKKIVTVYIYKPIKKIVAKKSAKDRS